MIRSPLSPPLIDDQAAAWRPPSIFTFFAFALALLGPSPAIAQEAYSGSGTVSGGSCNAADVFTDAEGRRFEIDRSRTIIPALLPVKITGKVYQRISVCKKFPWLDVGRFDRQGADQAPVITQGPDSGTLSFSIGRNDVSSFAQLVRALGKRNDILRVNVAMSDEAAVALPEILLELARDGGDAFEKIEIAVEPQPSAQFMWQSSRGLIKYKSLSEMRNAMALH